MPKYETHIRSVAEHLQSYETLDDECIRAKSILLFYAGMHIIEAVAKATDDLDFQHHSARSRFMHDRHRKESRHYHNLYDIGYQARYMPQKLSVGRVEDLDNHYKSKIIDKCLFVWAARVLDKPDFKNEVFDSVVLAESI
ncbi:hypothetical protein COB72_01905 [bacterium]|nr:MAG: hypothetical protein COB72_01905 [bacterium]